MTGEPPPPRDPVPAPVVPLVGGDRALLRPLPGVPLVLERRPLLRAPRRPPPGAHRLLVASGGERHHRPHRRRRGVAPPAAGQHRGHRPLVHLRRRRPGAWCGTGCNRCSSTSTPSTGTSTPTPSGPRWPSGAGPSRWSSPAPRSGRRLHRPRWRRGSRPAAIVGVPLLVDSAAGFGAVNADGVPVGAQGDAEVLSFHATKPFAIGEGGAVFSRDPDVVGRDLPDRQLRLRPRAAAATSGHQRQADELHAATGLAVLDRFDAALAARRDRAPAPCRARRPVLAQAGHRRGTFQFVPVLAADAAPPGRHPAPGRRPGGAADLLRAVAPLRRLRRSASAGR